MTNLMVQGVDFERLDFERLDFEACEAFRGALEHDEPVCASCGHLADDHDRPGSVVRLPGRRPAAQPRPARKAS